MSGTVNQRTRATCNAISAPPLRVESEHECDTLAASGAIVSSDRRPAVPPHRERQFVRKLVFAGADLVFLICIGALSAVLMQAAHWPMWNFWLCAAIGMVGAMTAQALLAMLVAPVLGSIEAMVPSMLVAMGSPMVVCTLHLSGREPGWAASAWLGAAIGAAFHLSISAYGARVRHRFAAERKTQEQLP